MCNKKTKVNNVDWCDLWFNFLTFSDERKLRNAANENNFETGMLLKFYLVKKICKIRHINLQVIMYHTRIFNLSLNAS